MFPDWNSLDSVRAAHSVLEAGALFFFAALVIFDVFAHFSDANQARAKRLEKIGLICFAIAVLAEIFAYPYSKHNDTLSSDQDRKQRGEIAALENSTQGLRTDAATAHEQAENFKLKIADSQKRADEAVAKVKIAEARSAEANVKAESFRLDIARANEAAEHEKLARLQLEKQLAPRSLTKDQMTAINTSVQALGSQRVDIFFYPNDPEILALASQIVTALPGWQFKAVQPLGGLSVSGILVEFDPSDVLARERATVLVKALLDCSLLTVGPLPTLPTPPDKLPAFLGQGPIDASLRLTIGKK